MMRVSTKGFTLIELMISIALVLFLILGVNQVFQSTTQAVGAGQAINSAIQDSRAAQSSMASDFASMVAPGSGIADSASLIISSSQVYAFRNKADQASDRDGNPATTDYNNNGIEGDTPSETITPCTYNFRNHRTDVISFFGRNQFHRQTGNLGTYLADMASAEAWIWYGHLLLPDNSTSATYMAPGTGNAGTNPNNFVSSQFVLGRVATLLREKSTDNASGTITDTEGNSQVFIDRKNPYPANGVAATELQPLWYGSNSTDAQFQLHHSRYDLAATSISGFRNKLLSYINANPNVNWYTAMMDGETASGTSYRFLCNPYLNNPINAQGMAQASPYFLPACSQFIVEFAGDFFSQDNNLANIRGSVPPGSLTGYGDYVSSVPDGQIDYVLIAKGTPQQRKQIIWYGLPRNTSGQSGINPLNGDVVPVGTWLGQRSFERTPAGGVNSYSWFGKPASMSAGSSYVCAWGPKDIKPKLIRITITVDDATGRLHDGQTYEFIFPVP